MVLFEYYAQECFVASFLGVEEARGKDTSGRHHCERLIEDECQNFDY